MTRRPALLALAVAGIVAAVGCTDAQRAEQQGKDVGEALCAVSDADGGGQVEAAVADVEQEIDELAADHVSVTAEDRAAVAEALDALVEDVATGDEALVHQDLARIRAAVAAIEGDVGDVSRAAASGVLQGLDDCA